MKYIFHFDGDNLRITEATVSLDIDYKHARNFCTGHECKYGEYEKLGNCM
jgi:hypothetical protein